ncbi:DUF6153 family protein [Streptomyces sp. HM190]|uniref:DUF6153 family protein n=1 Tax=Streptomyces sp. HM190 TaxID=2695266 RepID=UPI001F1D1D57|nr:DUF6153 family protein [Streptomyces sp. HM190]
MNRAHDGAVTGLGAPHRRPRPPLRARGLMVCALLLGLLGMHGLGPVPALHAAAGHDRMTTSGARGDSGESAASAVHTGGAEVPVRVSMPGACGHDTDGGAGHTHHADPTCASASVGQAPAVVPVLVPDVVTWAERAPVRASMRASGPEGGRAPPSLAALQLLRI